MEEPYQLQSTIKGKDLPGAIKVMPLGLDAAIKKRVSGEFKSERSGCSMTFSQTSNNQTLQSQTIETADLGSAELNFKQMDQQMLSSNTAYANKTGIQSQNATSQNAISSSTSQMSSTTMSSQKITSCKSNKTEFSSSFKSQQDFQQSCEASTVMIGNNQQKMLAINQQQMLANNQQQMLANNQQQMIASSQQILENNQQAKHGVEIKQENLKTQIQSAITDLENEIGPEFESQIKSPTPVKTDIFSPPPLERISEPPEHVVSKLEKSVYPYFETPIPNGHTIINSNEIRPVNMELHKIQEEYKTTSTKMNGTYEESSHCTHESGSSSSMLEKIMTPAPQEYDSGSLKRRDPRKMFTDSSFYSAAHHPTVADQVEMAHRLSSALFNEDNHSSKGQQMYLNRAKRSGETMDEEVSVPRHDKVPNLKLVMNPEGKVQEWCDIAPEDMPNEAAVATHANATVPSPHVETGAGKGGELFAKRRKKAENWVVDGSTVGQDKPSNFADKFMQKQMFQQQQFQQAQQAEQEQKLIISQQQKQQQQELSSRNQLESQQQFQQQSNSKQTQSLEIRHQQGLQQLTMNQQHLDLPENFQHCTLINRSNTPLFDTSCHNVQGINVWANTAPRGWTSSGTTHRVAGQKTINLNKPACPPVVAVCPATPSMDLDSEMQKMHEDKNILQQQEEMEQQKLEQQRIEQQKMEQQIIEQQRLEQQRMERQKMEEQRMEQQRVEQQRIEQERLDKQRIEEQQRLEQQKIEEERIEQQRVEQQRIEQERLDKQRIEEQQIEQQCMEQQRMEQQRLEERRIEQQRIEQQRIEQQRMEHQRMEQQRMDQQRMEQQMMEQKRLEQQNLEQQRIEQQRIEQQRMEQQKIEQQRIEQQQKQQQQQMALQQQQQIPMQQTQSTKMSSQTSSITSSKTTVGANEVDLEPEKRREYEAWFKNQEKEAMEYSACVQYQEKGCENQEMTTITTSTQQHFLQRQQQLVKTSQMQGDFQSIEMTESPSLQSRELQLAKPPLPTIQQNSSISQFNSLSQKSSQSLATREVARGKEYARATENQDYTSSLHPTTTGDNIRQGGDVLFTQAQTQSAERRDSQSIRDSGLFGGIAGDNNSLVDDTDYQKISVKNLVGHFSKVKPMTEIPSQYLPQQHSIGTGTAPSLNYLCQEQNLKKEFKKQETHIRNTDAMKTVQQQSSTSVSSYQSQQVQSSSMNEQQTKTQEKKQEEISVSTARRQSLKDYLLMDPATEHMKAGIIDPSAILRGERPSQWKQTLPNLTQTDSRALSYSSTNNASKKPLGPNISEQKSTFTIPFQSDATIGQFSQSKQQHVSFYSPIASLDKMPNPNVIIETEPSGKPPISQTFQQMPQLLCPNPVSEYEAIVQSSCTQYTNQSTPTLFNQSLPSMQLIPSPNNTISCPPVITLDQSNIENISPCTFTTKTQMQQGQHLISQTNTKSPQSVQTDLAVIQMTSNVNNEHSDLRQDDIFQVHTITDLMLPIASRSTAATPLPTTPFPPVDHMPSHLSPISTLSRPKTPILVTTRPSSVTQHLRDRHVSKDDIARMMAELNAPLPPMEPLPQDIARDLASSRASQGSPFHLLSSPFPECGSAAVSHLPSL